MPLKIMYIPAGIWTEEVSFQEYEKKTEKPPASAHVPREPQNWPEGETCLDAMFLVQKSFGHRSGGWHVPKLAHSLVPFSFSTCCQKNLTHLPSENDYLDAVAMLNVFLVGITLVPSIITYFLHPTIFHASEFKPRIELNIMRVFNIAQEGMALSLTVEADCKNLWSRGWGNKQR
jgi:hypothetical protein